MAPIADETPLSDTGQSMFKSVWTKRSLEAGFWLLLIGFFASLNSYIIIMDYARRSIEFFMYRLVVNEASSAFAIFLLVPFIHYWLKRFPLTLDHGVKTIAAHAGGAVIFSITHVLTMMALRELAFLMRGFTYLHAFEGGFFGFLEMLAYEFSKDLPVYLSFIIIIWTYRLHQTRKLQRRSLVGADTIMVKRGRGDRLLSLKDISYFQSSANYVRVFAGAEECLLRETLQNLEKRLNPDNFIRVHRSYIVRVDDIREIQALLSGGSQLELHSGAKIPVSRSYKDALNALLKAE